MEYNVLIIDLVPQDRQMVEHTWNQRGFQPEWVHDCDTACDRLRLNPTRYALVVMGAEHMQDMLLSVIQSLRQLTDLPFLICAKDSHTEKKIQSIDLGADIYLSSPETVLDGVLTGYSLVRRYRTMLENNGRQHAREFPCGLVILYKQRRALFKGEDMQLARREFDLLCCLTRNHGIVMEYAAIYENVWDIEFFGDDAPQQLWTAISNLRKAFQRIDDTADYILTKRNIGYQFSC